MSENVIDFDAARLKKMEKKFDDMVEEQMSEEDMIADFALTVLCDVIEVMSELDFNIRDNPESMKDILACVEAIRGLMHRTKGTEHPFQNISDTIFESIFEEKKDPAELLESFIEDMELELD